MLEEDKIVTSVRIRKKYLDFIKEREMKLSYFLEQQVRALMEGNSETAEELQRNLLKLTQRLSDYTSRTWKLEAKVEELEKQVARDSKEP